MNSFFFRGAALVISAGVCFISAGTLSQESAPQTSARQTAIDTGKTARSGADSSTARKQPPKAGAKNRRDATLSALLATLEKEDSLNALARQDSAAADVRNDASVKTRGIGAFILRMVQTARQHPRPFAVAGVMTLIILLWLIAVRIAGKKGEKRFMTTTRLSLMDGEVRRACVHIEKHFADPALTPVVVCAAIVTGEPFLEALFQKELGMSIAGYIAQTRIHHAKQVIRENPAAEVSAVAVQAGFADIASFKTSFEKLTGLTFEDFPRKTGTA
jgi:AraC-like DNA-binding protein